MTRVARPNAATVPDEGQILCERCGYNLTGLPATNGVCPECGRDVALSDPVLRREPAWEDPEDGRPEIVQFLATTLAVMVRPATFYRHLVTRSTSRRASHFALLHYAFASMTLGGAVYLHAKWFTDFAGRTGPGGVKYTLLYAGVLVVLVYSAFEITTAIAARLTHWEATYRGLRMPLPVVLRAMHYHAAHYVPVAAIALVTVVGYQWLLSNGALTAETAPMYLYVLCGEVVLAAVCLFKTYWASMRNVMYANR